MTGNFQVALSPLTDADGKVVGSVFLAHDINRRKRTEEALWVKDAAVESSLNAITLADLSGRLTYVNRSFLDLWGYEDDREVLGRTAPTFWQSSSQASAVMDAALSGKGQEAISAALGAALVPGSNRAMARLMP